MSYPYCYLGPTCQLEPFFMMKCKKQPALVCPIGNIGASACPMAAFSGFYESHEPLPSSDMRGIVLPHCNGHQNGHQSGYILHIWFVFCHPGGRRGNTEQVVAWWRHPVALAVALDMLHQAMPHISLQRLCMTIKMSCNGGTFVHHRRLFCLA